MKAIISIFILLWASSDATGSPSDRFPTDTKAASGALEKEDISFMIRQLFDGHTSLEVDLVMSMSWPLGLALSMGTDVPPSGQVGADHPGIDPDASSVQASPSSTSPSGASAGVISSGSLLAVAAIVVVGLIVYRRRSTVNMFPSGSSIGTDFTSVAA